MPLATLQAIRNKVRKLTRSPSVNQITDADIDEYVNTFLVYDLPETLRLFSFHKKVIFNVEPNVDTYPISDVLVDINLYQTFNPPVYIAGYKAYYSQSEEEFYNLYPFISSIQSTQLTGDGVTLAFAGTVTGTPMIPGKVAFTAKAANNDGLILSDDANPNGTLAGDGVGTIDYLTGAFTLNFTTAPAAGDVIHSQTVPYSAGRPTGMLYFDNEFVFRPIPDQVYQVQLEAFVRPTDLLTAGTRPELDQWWQYIAYSASKYILQDRMDMETVQMIMPELNRQERLVLRRTIVQQTNERTATIYNQNNDSQSTFNYY